MDECRPPAFLLLDKRMGLRAQVTTSGSAPPAPLPPPPPPDDATGAGAGADNSAL